MRFGKRLAEVTRGRGAHEPYVSYKDLKHTVSKISNSICSSGGHSATDDDDGGSSLDEAPPQAASASAAAGSASSASAAPAASASARSSRVEAHQRDFFRRVDADVAQAKAYVQRAVSALEMQLGDWQASAIVAGILFTPDQLEEIAAQLPFQVDDNEVLVEWLTSLQPAEKKQAARRGLLEKYSAFAGGLNSLLQYIEVNLTAIRKIFKKFEKKVPTEMRIQNVREYRAHHDLYMPAMQHLLVTAVHVQRLVFGLAAPGSGDPGQEVTAVAISQIGSESLALLSWLRGPAALDDVLGGAAATPIDVYAKPAADLSGCAAGPSSQRPSVQAPPQAPVGERPAAGYPSSFEPPRAAGAVAPGPITSLPGSQMVAVGPVPIMTAPGTAAAVGLAPAAAAAGRAYVQMGGAQHPGVQHLGGAPSAEDSRQEPAYDQDRGGRRRGGRGSRGGGRGRKGGGMQPSQGGPPSGGRGLPPEACGEDGPVLASQARGGVGRGHGMVATAYPAGVAVPQQYFALPTQAAKGAVGRRGAAVMAGRGGCGGGCGRGGWGGKGAVAPAACAPTACGGQGVATLDPQWFAAAMMPMFWPSPAGVMQMDGVARQGPIG